MALMVLLRPWLVWMSMVRLEARACIEGNDMIATKPDLDSG